MDINIEDIKKDLELSNKTKVCKKYNISYYELQNLLKSGQRRRTGKRGRKPKKISED